MKIIIPTLDRMDNQVTYNNIPDHWKKHVSFVVQDHEYAEMNKRFPGKVYGLPADIKRLSPTRNWIYNKFAADRYFVMDDDLAFIVKEPNPDPEGTVWLTRKMSDADFDDSIKQVEDWMNEGIVYGCFNPTWVMPSLSGYPFSENGKIMTNCFFNGPELPKGIQWERVDAAEDFDVNLQLLTQGFANRISGRYMVSPSETNAEGGCSIWRTLELHNESQRKLHALWPNFVKLREKEVKSGVWKGQKKLATTIYHKKAFASSQKPDNDLEELFA